MGDVDAIADAIHKVLTNVEEVRGTGSQGDPEPATEPPRIVKADVCLLPKKTVD